VNSEEVRTVLARRAAAIDATRPERVDELFGRIRRHRRQRTAAAVLSATCLVLALVAGLTLLASGTRDAAPPPAGPDQTKHSNDSVHTQLTHRRLTYAVGSTIHWGDRSIDVGQTVQAVGVTDDGVVFVRGDKACPYQVACRTLWFTDGAEPVRIGTVTGSWIRGFGIEFAGVGSTVVWSEPDPEDRSPYGIGEYVVYDTSLGREVGRFGSDRGMLLAVGDGTVFWVPNRGQCVEFDGRCVRFKDPIMRFDVRTGQQAAVSWESYWATRSSWPRTLVSPPHGKEIADGRVVRPPHADPTLGDSFGFQLHGTRLVGGDFGVAVTVRLARTGAPLQLRMPARYPSGRYFGITQWLDDDHVVMWAEDGALLVCRLPDGRCRTTVRHGGITGFGGRG
jgi:hypothetical protein